MKVLAVSDLHIDFTPWVPQRLLYDNFDVIVIAGDITNGCRSKLFLEGLIRYFGKPVIVVPGNHEYYGEVYEDANKYWKSLQSSKKMQGCLHVLINDVVEIGGQRFVGTTLWSNIPFHLYPLMMATLPDFKCIKTRRHDGELVKLTPDRYNRLHRSNVDFLNKELREGDYLITHHAVSSRSTAEQFRGCQENCGWIADISDLILERRPAVVHHGHVHASFDYVLGESRVICNPRGYVPYQPNPDFLNNLIIEI